MKNVLVTGTSSGIGRAAALRMARKGWLVHAGMLDLVEADGLLTELGEASGRIEPLEIDITSDESVERAVATLPEQLTAVVNNAGIAIDGPVESLTRERLRQQFEVNLFGHVVVTRAVLPRIRTAQGRIVFVSSISGRIATPWTAAYNASKFALECTADVLRLELRPWRIPVSVIEPTNTRTPMWENAGDQFDEGLELLTDEERTLYAGHIEGLRRSMVVMRRTLAPVDNVTREIERALTARRPRRRYPVGLLSKAQVHGAAIAPRPLLEWILAKGAGIPRRPK